MLLFNLYCVLDDLIKNYKRIICNKSFLERNINIREVGM